MRYKILILSVSCSLLHAATLTWNGSTNEMNQASNWSPSQVPVDNDDLIFPATGGLNLTPLNNIGTLTIGDLTISNTYTFTGSTFVVPAGTHMLTYGASGSNINLGSVTLTGIWNISSNAGGNKIQSSITGAGSLNLQGGLLELAGSNTYSGTTTLGTGATLRAMNTSAYGMGSDVTIGSGAFLDLNSFNNTIGNLGGVAGSTVSLGTATITVTNSGVNSFPGTISGTNAGFTLGTGSTDALTLMGNNTYSSQASPGSTTVQAGTLTAGSATAFGSHSNVSITGGTLDLNNFNNTFGTFNGSGALTLGSATVTVNQGGTFSGTFAGTGGLTLAGGTFTVNTLGYTGTTEIQNGSTTILVVDSLGTTSGVTFDSGGGTLQANMGITSAIPFTLNGPATIDTNGNAVTLNGNLTGTAAGTFTKTGMGTLALGGTNNILGDTAIRGGTLQAGSTSAIGTNSGVFIADSATFDLNGNNNTIKELSGDLNSSVMLGAGNLTITNGDITKAFYGVISGTGNVEITGGTQTFLTTNTYTGTTTVTSGATFNTLDLGMTSSLIFASGGGNVEFGSMTNSTATLVMNDPGILGTNTFDVAISGAISGTGQQLSKLGLGTLTLTGANTNAGPILIRGGVLNLDATSLGSTTAITYDSFGGTLQAGGPLTITQPITLSNIGKIDTNGNAVTVSGNITGGNIFEKLGTGTLTLSGGNNYTGKTVIRDGTLAASSASVASTTGQLVFSDTGNGIFQTSDAFAMYPNDVVFMANGAIDTNGFNSTFSGIFAGLSTNAFTKQGAGTLTLSGANIYTGPTNVNAGTLEAGIASTTTSGAFGLGSAVTVANGATLALNTFSNAVGSLAGPAGGAVTLGTGTLTVGNGNSQNFGGDISGMGGFTLTTGTQILSGSNTYAGVTTINGGVLQAGSTTAFSPASDVILSAGTLDLNNNNNTINSISGPAGGMVTLGSGVLTIADGSSQSFSGVISGTGGVTLTMGTATFGGLNTYTGATTVNGGTLQAGSTMAYGNNSAVTVANGATLDLNTHNNTVGSLTGPAGGMVTLGTGTLTVTNGNSLTFAGDISGTGGIQLNGGTWTLSGTNTYTGSTTVDGGTLQAGSTMAFGNGSAVIVQNSGTVDFQTFANTVGSISANSTVSASDTVTTTTYSQGASSTLNLDIPMPMLNPHGNIAATSSISIAGTLNVTNTGAFVPTAGTEIVLLESSGSGKQLSGTFATENIAAGLGTIHYDYSDNKVFLAGGGASGCTGTWTAAMSGNWGTTTNWSAGCAPGVSGVANNNDAATFGNDPATSITVFLANAAGTMPQDLTLHAITFDSSTTEYRVIQFNDGGTITLDGSAMSSNPRISVLEGSHSIDAPIVLNKDARLTVHQGATLTLGSNSSVTSTGNWSVSEGDGSGTLINQGNMSPANILIEGNVVENQGMMTPTGDLTVAGLGGISGTATLNNTQTVAPAGNLTISGADGPSAVSNAGTMNAGSGNTLSVLMGSTVTNTGTLGSSDASFVFSGGSITNSASILGNNYTQSGSANLQMNVTNTSSFATVAANGTANLGGTLTVNAQPGFSMEDGQSVTLLSSMNDIMGSFSNFSFQNFPSSVIPSLLFNDNNVVLNIREVAPVQPVGATVNVIFNTVLQHNTLITRKTVQLRNRITGNLGLGELATAALLEPFEEELIASNDEELAFINFSPLKRSQEQLGDRLRKNQPDLPWSVYFGPVSSFGSVDSEGTQNGLGYASVGALAGCDYTFVDGDDDTVLFGGGALLEYRRKWIDLDRNAGSTTIDRLHGSLYGTMIPRVVPELAFLGVLGFAYNFDTFERNTGAMNELVAVGKTTEQAFDILLGMEYTFSSRRFPRIPKNFRITPLLDIQYIYDKVNGYRETGAGNFNLSAQTHHPQSLITILGSRFDYLWTWCRYALQAELDIGWQHEYLSRSQAIGFTAFLITNTPTIASTVAPGRDSLLLAGDLLATFPGYWQLEGSCSYQYNSSYYDTFFFLALKKLF